MSEQTNPAGAATTPRERVIQAIEAIKPYLRADGGDIEFVDFTPEGIVQVRLHGACRGCPGARATLTYGVEARLRQQVPEVRGLANLE